MLEHEAQRLELLAGPLQSLAVPKLRLGRSVGGRVEQVPDSMQRGEREDRNELGDHNEHGVLRDEVLVVLVIVAVYREVRVQQSHL